MRKGWLWVAGLVLGLGIIGLTGCQAGSSTLGDLKAINIGGSQQEGIWVNGTGKVTVVPDIANLRLGIEAQQVSVAEAQTQAAAAMAKVMTALDNNGVAKKDIQTQNFNISKVTRWDDKNQREIVIGYRVTNTVTAKIRDINKAGSIIDAVALAGGDLTRIDSISFSVDDPTPYYEEARKGAMADAEAKAKQLAGLAGISLGKPTFISESTFTQPPPPSPVFRLTAEAAAPSTPINPGETEISISVQVTYAIK
ncbi:MAG: SIMPL domain-containing protein [Chloroflexi bacterium]|nr:SIMPL domain-containing protein [Chloroflexota bacterium]